jgi:amino acid adenylation domain-containing protein
LSRASEVTIGTIASHRNLPELNNAIGNFGNVVPLRISIARNWSFRRLLQHCAERCRTSFAHADIPFEHLLGHLNIPRGTTRNPLLDTMVTFLSHGMEPPRMDGLDVHWEKHFNGTSQSDLSFDALLQNGVLQLQATWRSSLYRTGTMQNHLRRLARLLNECVAAPDKPLTAHSLLLPEEHLQLEAWGARSAIPGGAMTLVGCFENTVRKLPDAIALSTTQRSNGNIDASSAGISFATLNARANKLARWLIAQGVGPEDRVALALSRRPEWFVAMLATLKAGAAFVPIDPTYPIEYIQRVITLAQPSLTFVSDDNSTQSSSSNQNDMTMSLAAAEHAAQTLNVSSNDISDTERRTPLQPAHPVCIVFTSGSSGEPKGVVVPHSAFVNLLNSHREDLYKEANHLTDGRLLRIGHAWSLAFDASWQPALWMFDGHEIHLFDVDVMQDPLALAREIILRRLDFIELTPGMLDEVLPWLQSGFTDAEGRSLPPHVPAVLAFGGESVKQALWDRILTLENTSGFNLYGPTEACVDSMISKARIGDQPNIGGPIAGAQVYVLDDCLQLAPPGVAGELALAGAGLARGYLKRGDLTAGQFIANLHGAPGSRLYRTGDRVRWLPGGILDYIGRIDEQVKIRGFRVEPLEVEATVEKMVQRPCAVVARKGNSGTQLLCFVEDGVTDTDALLQLFASKLPTHLLPKFVIPIAKLPRLPNGKINRRALVMPEGLDNTLGRSPRTPLEQTLCQLIAEVLGRDHISIDDGFFELGGDSISVIKLVSLARRHGLSITARQVFDTRCVARLASLLESSGHNKPSPITSNQHDNAETGPVSPTRLMTRYLSSGIPLQRFAQIVNVPLPPAISDSELEDLLTALVTRHAMLRARLVSPAGAIPQLDIPATGHSPRVQLQRISLPIGNGDAAQAKLARQLCDQLDPARGIMLAAARIEDEWIKGEQEKASTLWLAINHLVVDASSWHVLASDLALAREAQERGQPIELPPVPAAWRSWSAGQSDQSRSPKPSTVRGTLATATQLSWSLPAHSGQCPFASVSRQLGLPLSNLLPALVALAAMRAGLTSKGQSVRLAIEQHGREASSSHQDLSRTVGWFARELTIVLDENRDDTDQKSVYDRESLTQLLRRWNDVIEQTDGQAAEKEASGNDGWQLGFNFLGDAGPASKQAVWVPQPRMDLLVTACGEHWPLFDNLDINAHYVQSEGTRSLRFDAIAPATSMNKEMLSRLFSELQQLIELLAPAGQNPVQGRQPNHQLPLYEVTPLQNDMLRQCSQGTDPWTTQMELTLVATAELPLSALSLQTSAARLLARHQALRAGFLADSAATFIPYELEPDWQSLDWRGQSEAQQEQMLTALREDWYQHRFQLHKPPLVRFLAIHHSDDQWRLLVNSHHLLLDGWSVPRILNEWLGEACGAITAEQPSLNWAGYLDWLQRQDRSPARRYWNQRMHGLAAPSLLCPDRRERNPSLDLSDELSLSQSKALNERVKTAGVTAAALYQLAWAKTLAVELGHADVVFGLFDSGRAAPIEGLSSLVGLVTQLVPLRINAASPLSLAEQLHELQAQQFEWQTQVPIRLDNLEASQRFGELFDTLLVIENALGADAMMEADPTNTPSVKQPENPLALLKSQSWRDSIGQAVGLFIYPGHSIALRLCYDPQAIDTDTARQVLAQFKYQLQHLASELVPTPGQIRAADTHSPETAYDANGD